MVPDQNSSSALYKLTSIRQVRLSETSNMEVQDVKRCIFEECLQLVVTTFECGCGNAFGRVCLSVIVSVCPVCARTFEDIDL